MKITAGKKDKLFLALGDIHAPYHYKPAFKLLDKVAKANKFDLLIQVGDFSDLISLSKYPPRSLRKVPTVQQERRGSNALLDQIDAWGIPEKVMTIGNHDERLLRFLAENSRFQGFDGLSSTADFLNLKKRGWKWVEYGEDVQVGKFYFTHEVGYCGRTAHKQTSDLYRYNVVIGHTHRMAMELVGTRHEKHFAAMIGWLGDSKYIDYKAKAAAKSNYANGFAVGVLKPDGVVHMQLVPIINNEAWVFGKLYKA